MRDEVRCSCCGSPMVEDLRKYMVYQRIVWRTYFCPRCGHSYMVKEIRHGGKGR